MRCYLFIEDQSFKNHRTQTLPFINRHINLYENLI
jgi:hypothetical protein